MKKSYKTRGQGFTLIELLAVLVVLAILALIAIPIVIKVINNAREDSYKRSIEGYARAAELAVAQWGLQHPGEAFPTNLKTPKEIDENYTIDYKGDKVVCQEMYVEDTGLITLRYCQVMKNETEPKSTKYYKYVDSNVTEDTEPIVTYEEYSVGDSFTFGGAGYHVILTSDTSQDYVVALKDEPLTVDEVTALGFTPSYTYTGTTKSWAGMYYDNTEPKSSDYDTSDVKPVVDAWVNQYANKLREDEKGYKARLISYDDLTDNLGYEQKTNKYGNPYLSRSSVPSWVYNSEYEYWTMTPHYNSEFYVWHVDNNGIVYTGDVYDRYVGYLRGCVRPVINVLKSAITKN